MPQRQLPFQLEFLQLFGSLLRQGMRFMSRCSTYWWFQAAAYGRNGQGRWKWDLPHKSTGIWYEVIRLYPRWIHVPNTADRWGRRRKRGRPILPVEWRGWRLGVVWMVGFLTQETQASYYVLECANQERVSGEMQTAGKGVSATNGDDAWSFSDVLRIAHWVSVIINLLYLREYYVCHWCGQLAAEATRRIGNSEIRPHRCPPPTTMPPKTCQFCEKARAIIRRPKTGDHICKECFFNVFETEVHNTITLAKLFKPGDRVAIGASGGKGNKSHSMLRCAHIYL